MRLPHKILYVLFLSALYKARACTNRDMVTCGQSVFAVGVTHVLPQLHVDEVIRFYRLHLV